MSHHLLQPDAVVLDHDLVTDAQLEVEAGRVTAIHFDRAADATPVEGTLLPGFIDLQANGAGGSSVQEATPDALDRVAATVAEHGAVAFLPTLITAPFGALLEQVRAVAEWVAAQDPTSGSAAALGLHVEGPFMVTPGAHDAGAMLDPTPERVADLLAAGQGHIRLVTLAPTRAGAAAAVAQLRRAGVCVSLGHGAGAAGIAECIDAGATMATHLFNAMGPWSQRDPGMVGTVLDQPALSCGMIVDGVHVHEVWVRHAARLLGAERLVLVSDCVSAMGMPDGEYALGDMPVTLRDGAVRNRDGALAGSVLTMLQAGANYLRLVPEADAVALARVAASNPARLIGVDDRYGSIAVGSAARFTLLRRDGTLVGFDR